MSVDGLALILNVFILFIPMFAFVHTRFVVLDSNLVVLYLISFIVSVMVSVSFMKRKVVVGLVILYVYSLILLRMFYGPFDLLHRVTPAQLPRQNLAIVVLTVKGSTRSESTVDWVGQLNFPWWVEYDEPVVRERINETYIREQLGVRDECGFTWQRATVCAMYSIRRKHLYSRLLQDTRFDWYLILEDDAEPTYPGQLAEKQLHFLMSRPELMEKYDLIWSDLRNMISGGMSGLIPVNTGYGGEAGVFVNRRSLQKLIDVLWFNYPPCFDDNEQLMLCSDMLNARLCDAGVLQCSVRVMFRENGLPTSLFPGI